MNSFLARFLVAFLAGALGALGFQALWAGRAKERADTDLSRTQERLTALERALGAAPRKPGLLRAREAGTATAALAPTATGPAEQVQGALTPLAAEWAARVDAAVEKKIASMKERGELAQPTVQVPKKKRLALAEAARALELSGPQEDGLRRIYEETNQHYYKMLAAPDGDPQDVRRELEEAAGDPARARSVFSKYMPKFLGNIGEVMQVEARKAEAISKLLGAQKAKRLEREFSIREDDVLGIDGKLTVGAELGADSGEVGR